MHGRARVEAAFSPEGTPEIGAVVPYEGIMARDHWEEFTAFPWWVAQSPDLVHQLGWRRDLLRMTDQDWFVLPACAPRDARDQAMILVHGEHVLRIDRSTGAREELQRPRVGGWSVGSQVESVKAHRLPASLQDVEQAIPAPGPVDRRRVQTDGTCELARSLLHEFGRSRYPVRHVLAPLWATYGLWGFEGMMTLIGTRPDLVHHACERLLARAMADVQRAAVAGVAGIWIEDCMTDMISPSAFAALNLAYLERLTAAIREAGMHSIYYYCGDPAGKWDHLLAIGADALSFEESKKGFSIDIEEVVDRVQGRVVLLGNLDAVGVLQDGSEEQLESEIAHQLYAGRRNGGRFIMSLGSPVTPATPMERVRRYCDLVHEIGHS